MKIENWCGHEIHFYEVREDEWWADLRDICSALGLDVVNVVPYLGKKGMTLVEDNDNHISLLNERRILVNEFGIYELLIISDKLDAQKFRRWMVTIMQKLRKTVGLDGYEVMRMTEPEIQQKIDDLLDTIYYDPETGMVMRSVTIAGGDVEQIPFE